MLPAGPRAREANKKAPRRRLLVGGIPGGDCEIRTHGRLPFGSFQDCWFKPLTQVSGGGRILAALEQAPRLDERHHLAQARQRLQVGHHEGFEHALRIGARMVVYRRGQLLAMYLVTQVADYPSVSAKFWEKALEMIERRQICSGGQGTTIPA